MITQDITKEYQVKLMETLHIATHDLNFSISIRGESFYLVWGSDMEERYYILDLFYSVAAMDDLEDCISDLQIEVAAIRAAEERLAKRQIALSKLTLEDRRILGLELGRPGT